jgi:hypothetical protein
MVFAAYLLKPLDHAEVLRCIGDLLGLDLELDGAIEESVPDAAPPFLRRPDAHALASLCALIEDGQVSEIVDWAEKLKSSMPDYADFADRVTTAVHALDFPTLRNLAET